MNLGSGCYFFKLIGGPNLFFLFDPFATDQIINGINPIIVIDINIHQPDLLTSCNLLARTAVAGKNNIMVLTISNGPHETELSTNIESIITAKKPTRA